MLEYNHYLLNEKPKGITTHIDKKALLEMLKGLSKEERMELMAGLADWCNRLSQEYQTNTAKCANEQPQNTKQNAKIPSK